MFLRDSPQSTPRSVGPHSSTRYPPQYRITETIENIPQLTTAETRWFYTDFKKLKNGKGPSLVKVYSQIINYQQTVALSGITIGKSMYSKLAFLLRSGSPMLPYIYNISFDITEPCWQLASNSDAAPQRKLGDAKKLVESTILKGPRVAQATSLVLFWIATLATCNISCRQNS